MLSLPCPCRCATAPAHRQLCEVRGKSCRPLPGALALLSLSVALLIACCSRFIHTAASQRWCLHQPGCWPCLQQALP